MDESGVRSMLSAVDSLSEEMVSFSNKTFNDEVWGGRGADDKKELIARKVSYASQLREALSECADLFAKAKRYDELDEEIKNLNSYLGRLAASATKESAAEINRVKEEIDSKTIEKNRIETEIAGSGPYPKLVRYDFDEDKSPAVPTTGPTMVV